MKNHKTAILMAASNWFPLSVRMAMAFLSHGCSVSAVCPQGHPMALVPGIGRLYRYRGVRSLESLRRAIVAANPDMIVPCDDGVVQQLHQLHAAEPELRAVIERSLGSPDGYAVVASRERLLDVAAELGVRVPWTRSVRDEAELAGVTGSAVLKADGSAGGEGVAIAHGSEEMLAAFRRLSKPMTFAMALKRFLVNRNPLALWAWRRGSKQAGPQVVMQEFVPGRPANTMIACWQGRVLASVTVEVLRSQGETGAATVVRLIWNEAIELASRLLAERLELNGFHGLDFMLEADRPDGRCGRAYLIEMNPRCTQLGHLTLPDQGDLAGAMLEALGCEVASGTGDGETLAGETIAFFPQACLWNPRSPYLRRGYHDVPWAAPGLMRELLLEEWPYRQWPARVYHRFFPPGRRREVRFEGAAREERKMQVPVLR